MFVAVSVMSPSCAYRTSSRFMHFRLRYPFKHLVLVHTSPLSRNTQLGGPQELSSCCGRQHIYEQCPEGETEMTTKREVKFRDTFVALRVGRPCDYCTGNINYSKTRTLGTVHLP